MRLKRWFALAALIAFAAEWATPITPVRGDPAKAGRGLLAPTLLRLPGAAAGPDAACCERLEPLYEVALVVEAVAEYVGPVCFIPVPDWSIVPPLTQPARWD